MRLFAKTGIKQSTDRQTKQMDRQYRQTVICVYLSGVAHFFALSELQHCSVLSVTYGIMSYVENLTFCLALTA